jgi:hypothetical protein
MVRIDPGTQRRPGLQRRLAAGGGHAVHVSEYDHRPAVHLQKVAVAAVLIDQVAQRLGHIVLGRGREPGQM